MSYCSSAGSDTEGSEGQGQCAENNHSSRSRCGSNNGIPAAAAAAAAAPAEAAATTAEVAATAAVDAEAATVAATVWRRQKQPQRR